MAIRSARLPSRETAIPQLSALAITATVGVLILPHLKPFVQSLSAYCSRLYHQWFVLTLTQAPDSIHGIGKGTVSQLYTHPVKSLRSVAHNAVTLDAKGFCGDRRFMIVIPNPPLYEGLDDPDHAEMRFLTQRQLPLLATVVAQLTESTVTLTTDKLPQQTTSISLQPNADARTYRSTLWGDTVLVQDMGEEAASFLQALATQDLDCPAEYTKGLRLVRQANDDTRSTNKTYVPGSVSSSGILTNQSPPVGLPDGFPILIASEASLEELNRRLVAKNKTPIDMSRFRPNLVIRGTKAFEEDYWKVIRIGNVVLHVVKGCPRCKQSCIDQTTGAVSDEPLATLTEFRALNPENTADVFFGQNVLLDHGMQGKEIRVGDAVTVLQWTDKPVYEGD